MNSPPSSADPKKRIVACLDILGFKEALKSMGALALRDLYYTAVQRMLEQKTRQDFVRETTFYMTAGEDKGTTTEEERLEPAFPKLEHTVLFSDSIFIFSTDDSIESAEQISEFSNWVFQLFLHKGLLLRGGIASGECSIWPEEDIYLGDAIVSAYKLENSIFAGIVIEGDYGSDRFAISQKTEVLLKCGHTQSLNIPSGPLFKIAPATRTALIADFEQLREKSGPKYAERYDKSKDVVSIMLQGAPGAFDFVENHE